MMDPMEAPGPIPNPFEDTRRKERTQAVIENTQVCNDLAIWCGPSSQGCCQASASNHSSQSPALSLQAFCSQATLLQIAYNLEGWLVRCCGGNGRPGPCQNQTWNIAGRCIKEPGGPEKPYVVELIEHRDEPEPRARSREVTDQVSPLDPFRIQAGGSSASSSGAERQKAQKIVEHQDELHYIGGPTRYNHHTEAKVQRTEKKDSGGASSRSRATFPAPPPEEEKAYAEDEVVPQSPSRPQRRLPEATVEEKAAPESMNGASRTLPKAAPPAGLVQEKGQPLDAASANAPAAPAPPPSPPPSASAPVASAADDASNAVPASQAADSGPRPPADATWQRVELSPYPPGAEEEPASAPSNAYPEVVATAPLTDARLSPAPQEFPSPPQEVEEEPAEEPLFWGTDSDAPGPVAPVAEWAPTMEPAPRPPQGPAPAISMPAPKAPAGPPPSAPAAPPPAAPASRMRSLASPVPKATPTAPATAAAPAAAVNSKPIGPAGPRAEAMVAKPFLPEDLDFAEKSTAATETTPSEASIGEYQKITLKATEDFSMPMLPEDGLLPMEEMRFGGPSQPPSSKSPNLPGAMSEHGLMTQGAAEAGAKFYINAPEVKPAQVVVTAKPCLIKDPDRPRKQLKMRPVEQDPEEEDPDSESPAPRRSTSVRFEMPELSGKTAHPERKTGKNSKGDVSWNLVPQSGAPQPPRRPAAAAPRSPYGAGNRPRPAGGPYGGR
eukprot:TRINITY_DN8796_c2_g1_i1.p1 TRINITY_DN8796_c2_g1~~TRINITY_DN8796_c2_g1_i1.p1  ORF type:complete len:723 (-),score=134.25 TRINITY_DN8796_c2_g1_i1:146-2314(-)